MRKGDPLDPLFLQVWPQPEERNNVPGFVEDPVRDGSARIQPGLLQKYPGRALLITTGSCAVHCRYCFRREYPYGEQPRSLDEWEPAFQSLEADASISEVILSGGDPLVLSDRRLREFVQRLSEIPHLRVLRVHTRLPVVLPQRVTSQLLETLIGSRLQPILVIHANHAHELVADCAAAIRRFPAQGIMTLNQAVLLKGVNDSLSAQQELWQRCVELGVIPYYLHQLDRVQGAAHFEVDPHHGRTLIAELQQRCPGYVVPRYVQEVPGASSKTSLTQS